MLICQTGAGKSTLAELMVSKGYGRNLEVDNLGHDLLKDSATIQQLTDAFGKEILTDNQIDRKKLGAKAFESPAATETLNSIMHPNMVKMVEKINKNNKQPTTTRKHLTKKTKPHTSQRCFVQKYSRHWGNF